MVGELTINLLKMFEIHHKWQTILRHHETVPYNLTEFGRQSRDGWACSRGQMGMRDWFLLTTIMVLGFGFTLGKLAFDEWRIKRGKRNPRLHS